MVRQNGCFQCHAIDKTKNGPAYRDVAPWYRGKPEAAQRLITHITCGEKANRDGHEKAHKIFKTKDAGEIKNGVQWLPSQ